MPEIGAQDNLNKYIPVEAKHTNPTIRITGIRVPENPSQDYIARIERDIVLKTEREMRQHQIEPSKALKEGYAHARKMVHELRTKTGLPQVDLVDMEVITLEKSVFDEHYKIFSGKEDPDLGGFSSGDLEFVLVKDIKDMPEYVKASAACHELVHKWLEQHAKVYHVEGKQNFARGQSAQSLLSEPRRSGLMVKKIGYKEGQFSERGLAGTLLNELPNYMAEKAFVDKVLNGEIDTFKKEVISRRQMLIDYLKENGIDGDPDQTELSGVTNEGNNYIIDSSNLHFDINGNPLLSNAMSFMAQLGSDLSKLCGDINGRPFGDVLLEAKLNPVLQNDLRKAIDSKMGPGYFTRLKNADLNSAITILSEVQAKLYPNTSQPLAEITR